MEREGERKRSRARRTELEDIRKKAAEEEQSRVVNEEKRRGEAR